LSESHGEQVSSSRLFQRLIRGESDEALRKKHGSKSESALFSECLYDWIAEHTPVRAIDLFVEELGLGRPISVRTTG
jgi:hypothetical protein